MKRLSKQNFPSVKIALSYIFLFFISVYNIHAQTNQLEFGLGVSPAFTTIEKSSDSPALNFSIGLFYNYHISSKVELGSALNYKLINLRNPFIFNGSTFDKLRFYEIPLLLNINLLNEQSKTKPYLVIGYSYAKLMNHRQAVVDYNLNGLVKDFLFFNCGLELKKKVYKNYRASLGAYLKITNIYNLRYGEIRSFELVLKLGKIWY